MSQHRHIGWFLTIGVASTLTYALLFTALAGPVGSAAANAAALVITAVANTAANRRLTFGLRGRQGLARQHLAGLLVFAVALVLTSGVLGVLHAFDPRPPRPIEMLALVVANLAATVTRYVALSTWIFPAPPTARRRRAVLPVLAKEAQ